MDTSTYEELLIKVAEEIDGMFCGSVSADDKFIELNIELVKRRVEELCNIADGEYAKYLKNKDIADKRKREDSKKILRDSRYRTGNLPPPEKGFVWQPDFAICVPGREDFISAWARPALDIRPDPTEPENWKIYGYLPFYYAVLLTIYNMKLPVKPQGGRNWWKKRKPKDVLMKSGDTSYVFLSVIWGRIQNRWGGYDKHLIKTALRHVKQDLIENCGKTTDAEQKPKQEKISNLYKEINITERTIIVGDDKHFIKSEPVWGFIKTLIDNKRQGIFTSQQEGLVNWKNSIDMLRRQIGKECYHEIISTSRGLYSLEPSVKVSGGGQIGIKKTKLAKEKPL